MMARPAPLLAFAALLLVSACARWQPLPPQELSAAFDQRPVELDAVPFHPQTRNHCGPAALATALGASGVTVQPAELADEVFIPARQGSLQIEMQAAVRRHGRLAYQPGDRLDDLLAALHAGHPVIVFHNLGITWLPYWHYEVVVGFDPAAGEFISRSGTTRRKRTPAPLFLRTWDRAGRWALVALKPGELPARVTSAAYIEAVAALERTGGPVAAGPAWLAGTQRWPAEAMPWLGLGNARLAEGEPAEAVRAYRAALARRPDLAAARNNFALALANAGCVASARHELEAALETLDRQHPLARELERTLDEIRAAGADDAASPLCAG